MSGGEGHLESTESVADERERITVKPRNQNAGEGGNSADAATPLVRECVILNDRYCGPGLCGACESA